MLLLRLCQSQRKLMNVKLLFQKWTHINVISELHTKIFQLFPKLITTSIANSYLHKLVTMETIHLFTIALLFRYMIFFVNTLLFCLLYFWHCYSCSYVNEKYLINSKGKMLRNRICHWAYNRKFVCGLFRIIKFKKIVDSVVSNPKTQKTETGIKLITTCNRKVLDLITI